MKKTILAVFLTVIALASCSKDPEYADKEAYEKTLQLKRQYAPIIVGTWHFEQISDDQHFFEQLTFQSDGTLRGLRKWQTRQLVTIDGKEQYTDWENIDMLNGSFLGDWVLHWERDSKGEGHNRIVLYGKYTDPNGFLAYSHNLLFDTANDTTLQFQGYFFNEKGWTVYQRGAAEPSF
jgi:hypothetical protein